MWFETNDEALKTTNFLGYFEKFIMHILLKSEIEIDFIDIIDYFVALLNFFLNKFL
jgi:hypothetical protein